MVVVTLFDRGEDVTDSQGLLRPPLTVARPHRGNSNSADDATTSSLTASGPGSPPL